MMNVNKLISHLKSGEKVIVLDISNSEVVVVDDGIVESIEEGYFKSDFNAYINGTKYKISTSHPKIVVFNKDEYDAQLLKNQLFEYSGVVGNSLKWLSSSLSNEEMAYYLEELEKLDSHIQNKISSMDMSDKKGLDLKGYQYMWGRKNLTLKTIANGFNKNSIFMIGYKLGDLLKSLQKRILPENVHAIKTGEIVDQKSKKKGS
jgi:hypothetical protein